MKRLRSAHLKDSLREIKKTLNRFLSIFFIVALGAAFFSGLKMTCPDMLLTADKYYKTHNLMDIKLVSTYGFNDDDIKAIENLAGVKDIFPSYSKDVFVENSSNANIIAKVMALPDDGGAEDMDKAINAPVLMEGRMPSSPDECLIDLQLGKGFGVGKTITITGANEEDDPLSDSLNRNSWKIVGTVRSPLYISFERGSTDIGNGQLNSYIMVPMENFNIEVFTEVYVTLEKADISAFGEEYEKTIREAEIAFEEIAEVREELRYTETIEEANEKIKNAEVELGYGRKEAFSELGEASGEIRDAKKELLDARKELTDGWGEYYDGEKELRDAQKEFEEKIADGEKELQEAREKLDDGWEDYYDGMAELENGKKEYRDGKAQLDDAQWTLNEAIRDAGYSSIESMERALNEGQESLDMANELLDGAGALLSYPPEAMNDPGFAATVDEISAGLSMVDPALAGAFGGYFGGHVPSSVVGGAISAAKGALAQNEKELEKGFAGLLELTAAEAEINDGYEELKEAKRLMDIGEKELLAAYDQLLEGERQYDEGYADLEEGKIEGETEISDAKIELADAYNELSDGEKEYADGEEKFLDGEKEYNDAVEDVYAELADAKAEIEDAKEELAKLKRPVWYIFDRNDNPGYSSYEGDANRVEAVAAVFPFFFFLVAALVSLTTMTRMVEEHRTEMGTYKALGYSSGAIASKFIVYSTVASIGGAVFGIAVGATVFPTIIFGAYGMMYTLPELTLSVDIPLFIGITIACLLCTTFTALCASIAELRSSPAVLMRPRAPRPGKRVLLERIPFIWSKLSFTRKVTVRNLFRYKKRIFMTIVGIAGCTALTMAGFGINSSISTIMDTQYSDIFKYELITVLDDKAEEEETEKVYSLLSQNEYTTMSTPVYQKAVDTDNVLDISLFVFSEPEKAEQFIDFRERVGKKQLHLEDEGVIITEKLSELLSVKAGENITFSMNKKSVTVPISGITENYALHFIYMTPTCFENAFGELPAPNIVLSNMNNTDKEVRDQLASDLIELPAVLALTFSRDSQDDFNEVIENLNYVVLLVIVCAALLAFIVLYNLTNINVTERIREIATIKVLGFYDNEVSSYVYRENMILTVMGSFIGLGLGVWLHAFVISVAETDAAMFGRTLPPWVFLASFFVTVLFSLIVNFIMHFRLKKISMVESLKSVE